MVNASRDKHGQGQRRRRRRGGDDGDGMIEPRAIGGEGGVRMIVRVERQAQWLTARFVRVRSASVLRALAVPLLLAAALRSCPRST